MSSSRWRQRLQHLTFAWFTSSMSLGGIANLLLSRIIPSDHLYYLGFGLFCLNLVYLLTLLVLQVVRYTITPASLGYTLSHPIECCFIPTALLACATVINAFSILVDGSDFPTSPAWSTVLRVAFWTYLTASLLVSLVCYTSLWSRAESNLHHMNPAWVLPIFPLMLCGSVAASIVPTQSESHALVMSICGLTCQGLGFTLSCMMYAVLLLKLMTVGLLPPRARPGMFMCCGPPAFTIICLLGLSSQLPRLLPSSDIARAWHPLVFNPVSFETLSLTALCSSILLWFIAAWFYLLTLCTILRALVVKQEREQVEFILAWWATVFPITGFATATQEIGEALDSTAIRTLARIMVVWLMICFLLVAAAHARAVWKGGIMAEGKDEDRVLDTMEHRYARNRDMESGQIHSPHHSLQDSGNEEFETRMVRERMDSNPPTYPSTPSGSVLRFKMGGENEKHEKEETHEMEASTSFSSGCSSRVRL